MSQTVIQPIDVQTAGFCQKGGRAWLKERGFEESAILDGKMTAEFARSMNCAFGNRVAAAAEARCRAEEGAE